MNPTADDRALSIVHTVSGIQASEHDLLILQNRIAAEIRVAEGVVMDTLATALRKFAPDLAREIAERHQDAAKALDAFVDVLRPTEEPL